jgi:hypothetical protein
MSLKKLDKTITYEGFSGVSYKFDIYSMNIGKIDELCSSFKENACGIYIFTNRQEQNDEFKHKNVYCGKSSTLDTRFNNHKEEILNKYKANCVSIHSCTEEELDEIEKDILLNNKFPCNIQNNSWY